MSAVYTVKNNAMYRGTLSHRQSKPSCMRSRGVSLYICADFSQSSARQNGPNIVQTSTQDGSQLAIQCFKLFPIWHTNLSIEKDLQSIRTTALCVTRLLCVVLWWQRGQTGLFSVKVCNQDRKLCVDGTPCWVKFSLQHCIYLLTLLWNQKISMYIYT